MSVSSISDNEEFLLLSNSITTRENNFYLLESTSGKLKEISTAPGSYSSAGFSSNNKSLYYITDVNKEFAYLMKYDIASGRCFCFI